MDVADRPSGLATFLFTDIQGSTRLWERYPGAMALALARHDTIMRVAIASGDHATAISHYEAALAINPAHVSALNGLAWAQYQTNRIDEAVATATRGTEVTPHNPYLWTNLGLYAVALDNTAERDSAYQQFFTTLDDEPSQTHISRGLGPSRIAELTRDARRERP